MPVRVTVAATHDLRNLQEYLEPRSPQGLRRLLQAIFTSMRRLETYPHLGRSGDIEGTREMSIPQTDFRLIYRVSPPNNVDIIRVLHGKRQYPPSQP